MLQSETAPAITQYEIIALLDPLYYMFIQKVWFKLFILNGSNDKLALFIVPS